MVCNMDFEYVVAAMHSRAARRDLQFETPKVLWDAAASEDGEFRVWRMILGDSLCMHCKHPASAEDPEIAKAKQLTALLGLDEETWLRKKQNNEPFTSAEIMQISERIGSDPGFQLPTVGERCDDWEASQCGKLQLEEIDEEVPIPFAPVAAGTLLAGEVIKEFCFPDAVLKSRYWNTLLGQFIRRATPQHPSPRPDCEFCSKEPYINQYRRRWIKLSH